MDGQIHGSKALTLALTLILLEQRTLGFHPTINGSSSIATHLPFDRDSILPPGRTPTRNPTLSSCPNRITFASRKLISRLKTSIKNTAKFPGILRIQWSRSSHFEIRKALPRLQRMQASLIKLALINLEFIASLCRPRSTASYGVNHPDFTHRGIFSGMTSRLLSLLHILSL